jgi:hypothetical protein
MASRKTYTCFVCQKAGHEVQVFLDGKDEQGRTKNLNVEGTKHTYLESSQQQQAQSQKSTTVITEPIAKILNAKLGRIIALLETELKKEDCYL